MKKKGGEKRYLKLLKRKKFNRRSEKAKGKRTISTPRTKFATEYNNVGFCLEEFLFFYPVELGLIFPILPRMYYPILLYLL